MNFIDHIKVLSRWFSSKVSVERFKLLCVFHFFKIKCKHRTEYILKLSNIDFLYSWINFDIGWYAIYSFLELKNSGYPSFTFKFWYDVYLLDKLDKAVTNPQKASKLVQDQRGSWWGVFYAKRYLHSCHGDLSSLLTQKTRLNLFEQETPWLTRGL